MAESKMVTVSQTEDEIKIVIELTKVLNTKPVVIVNNNFIKFNCPPVYFESFLSGDVEENQSVCRLFKRQARIILKKKQPGIWPNILEKVPREEALKKKVELNDMIVERTKREDKERHEQFDAAKKEKLQYQIDREMSIHDRVKDFKEASVATTISCEKAEAGNDLSDVKNTPAVSRNSMRQASDQKHRMFRYVPAAPLNETRKSGKIQISFSEYKAPTPKRESQNQPISNNNAAPNIQIY